MAGEIQRIGEGVGRLLGSADIGAAVGELGDRVLSNQGSNNSPRDFQVVEVEEKDGWTKIGPHYLRYEGPYIYAGQFTSDGIFKQVVGRLK